MAGEMSLGKILIEFGVELGELQRGLQEVKDSVQKTGDEAKKQGQSSLSDYAQKWFFVKSAVMDVAGFMKGMMETYASQERAVNKLNLSLGVQGNLLPGLSQKLQDQATALQRTTTYADDAITSGQAYLAQQGLTGDAIMEATPKILDMASALGMDVNSAFMLAGRAAGGYTSALARYGIRVDESLPKGEKFGALLDQMGQKFGGMSEVIAKDAIGRMQMFTNAMDDAKEGVGKLFQFMVESTLGNGQQAFAWIERFGTFFSQDLIIYLGMARQGFSNMVAGILEGAAGIGDAVSTISGWFGMTFGVEQVATLRNWAQAFRDSGQAMYDEAVAASQAAVGNQELQTRMEGLAGAVASTDTNQKNLMATLTSWNAMQAQWRTELAATAAAEVEHAALMADVYAGITNEVVVPFIDGYNMAGGLKQAQDAAMAASARRLGVTMKSESADALAKMKADYDALTAAGLLSAAEREKAEKKLAEMEKAVSGEVSKFKVDTFMSGTASILGAMSAFGGKFKALAIGEAVINTYVGATKAIRDYGWPMGPIFAAATIASGFAQIMRIKSQSFAEGTPRLDFANFGPETPAMLHGSEAVIPRGGGHSLAGEIASSLASMPSGDGRMSVAGGPPRGGGEIVIQNQIQSQLMLDGRVLAEAIEELTKTGRARVHPTAVKEF